MSGDEPLHLGRELSGEGVHHRADVQKCLRRDFGNRGAFDVTEVLDGYLRNEICACVKLRLRLTEEDGEDVYALVSNSLHQWGRHPYDGNIAVRTVNVDLSAKTHRTSDHDEQPVLVGVAPFTKEAEDRRDRLRGLIRLYRADEFLGSERHALYVSALDGLYEFFGRRADGELMSVAWCVPVRDDESREQVIEGRSQSVDHLTNQDAESKREGQL